MAYLRLISVLILINFFSLTLKASNIQEDQHEARSNVAALSTYKIEPHQSLISSIWNKVSHAFSLIQSKNASSEPQEISNLSWYIIPQGKNTPEWHRQGHDIFYHISQLSYDNINDFFDYLGTKLSKPETSAEFSSSIHAHRKLILSNFHKIMNIEVNEKNISQFNEAFIDFYRTLKKGPLPSLIKRDHSIQSQQFYLDNDQINIFQQGLLLAKCLKEITSLGCQREKLPLLQNAVKRLYRELDGGQLQAESLSTLRRLGVSVPRKVDWFQVGKGLTFLLLIGSAGTLNAVAAQRPQLLEDACSGTYKECESAFALLDCCGYTDEITALTNNINFRNAISGLFNPLHRTYEIADPFAVPLPRLNASGYYSEIGSYRVFSLPLEETSIELYNLYPPAVGYNNTQINNNSYNQTQYNINNIGSITPNISTIGTTTLSGNMNYYYLDQIPGTEVMVLTVMNNDGSFGIGNAVINLPTGVGSLLWQRLITNTTAANRIIPANISMPVTVNKPSTASERDNSTFDAFLNSLYSGYVDSPSGHNSRSIQQFAADNNLIPNGVISCLQNVGLDPIACSKFISPQFYTRFTYFFIEQNPISVQGTIPVFVSNLYRTTINTVDNINVKNTVYQQLNSTAIQQLGYSYPLAPEVDRPNTNNTVLFDSITPIRGNLTLGTVEKFAELYFPNSTAAIVLRVSQSASGGPVNYYAILGPEIVAATAPGGSSSSSSSDSTIIGAAVGGGVGGAAVLACLAAGGFAGYKYRQHNKRKAFEEEDDIEMDNRSSHIISQEAFNAKGEGLEDARLRVKGAMHGLRYGLYFTVDRYEAREIKAQTGLKITVPKDKEEIPFHLGAGNFGRVIIAKEEDTGQFRAMKIVAGTKNVKASLREGKLQARLGQKEGVLPLLEYLHLAPTGKNKKQMKQLLEATFGSSTIQGEDMTTQDLLLQVTPLAAFGNGETFQKNLAGISNKKLKDQLLTHFALSLLTGLKNMHDDGVSHLDIKPSNVLVHTDGTIYVSDFGCALQKDNLRGGLGDFRYFSPERIGHCRSLMYRKGHEFAAMEMFPYFSGKAADAFAAGLTLLEIATNKYPLGVAISVTNMLNERDSDYFKDHLEDAYEEVSKNLTILPIIKGLLHTKPKKRFSTLKAQEELLKLKPKGLPKELFGEFRRALLEKNHSAKSKDVHTAPASSSSTSYAYEDKLPSQQHDEKELALVYENKLPSEQVYGEEIPSLYKELGQDYSEASDLKSSNYSDKTDDVYSVPNLSPFNDNNADLTSSNESVGADDVYSMPKLSPFNDNKEREATYEEPELSPFGESSYAYATPKLNP